MRKFKNRWGIKQNWQLIFPLLGLIILAYLSYKLSLIFFVPPPYIYNAIVGIILFYSLLKFFLIAMNKMEKKWKVSHKWEMITIFIVFAITGTSSVYIGKPIMKFIGITRDNLPIAIYWILYILIGFIFYQILLVIIGWLFGQHKFFWSFEKSMLCKLGFKRFFN